MDAPGAVPKLHVAVLRSRFQHREGAINAFAKGSYFDYLESLNAIVRVQEVAAVNVHGARLRGTAVRFRGSLSPDVSTLGWGALFDSSSGCGVLVIHSQRSNARGNGSVAIVVSAARQGPLPRHRRVLGSSPDRGAPLAALYGLEYSDCPRHHARGARRAS